MLKETTSIYHFQTPQIITIRWQKNIAFSTRRIGICFESSLEGYSSIFNPENGNNPEMIFEVQGSSIVGKEQLSTLFSPKDSGLCGSGWVEVINSSQNLLIF